ncbi:MAG: hypothetical protein IJ932_00035 [Ruminococcus sp.]|nr:hypothetical protein [Ruminococcus sp.]
MTKVLKRPLSVLLAALMIVSLFAAVPMTVNAGSPDSGSGTGIGGTGIEIGGSTTDGYVAEKDYLTFTALQDDSSVMFTVQSGSDFKYNKNGDGWHDYNIYDYDRIWLNKGEYVRFRGSDTVSKVGGGNFGIGGKVAASGNIMSLRLDSESRSQGLTRECFINMFSGCVNLTAAPELPEKTLAYECYDAMFEGCSNLTTAPELPATTLAYGCYADMFMGCTSLTEAPALPATSLADACYNSMFSGCTSLTELPELPAKTLTQYCYRSMFYGCSSIRISDEAGTFSGIKYSEEYRIPTEGTATNASYALYNMFASTGGRFKGTPSLNTTYYIGKPVYTVKWKNGDTVIETDTDVESGAAPSFDGETPEKAEDETNTYTFSGWSDGNTTYGLSDTLPNVTADVTYTAQFTATPKHTHVMTAHEAVAATCTTAGTSAYWECTGCGKFFSDEDGNSEIDDIDAWLAEGGAGYVAALGHNKTHYPAVAATFDAPGNIEYWYCDRCEKYFSDENCENEITQAQTVVAVRAHEILSDADFAYAAANGGTDWYLKADVNADGVTIASNLKIWNTDKTHTISGDITIADGCEFAVAGKKTTNLTGKVALAGQDSKATSLRTPEIILTQPYKSGQVYGSPASTIITYNGRKIIYDATSLTAAAKNGGEYYVVDDIAISGATTVKADLTITGLKEDGSTPVITVSAPTSAKPFCLFNLSSGVDITIENVDFAATLSNTKTVGVVSADLNSSATSYNTVTITDSEISGFSVSDGYGAVYLHGYTQAVLTNVEMSGNGKYDVWVGSKGTVDIIGGDTGNVYLHSYSGTGAQLYAAGGANIDKITLDTTVTTTLKTDIGRATVGAIEANGDIPSEVVVIDPSVSSVNAPDGYEWAFSEEEGRKTLAPIDPESPLQGKAQIDGYQQKIAKTEQSVNETGNDIYTNGVRIVTKVDNDFLSTCDDYGYVVAKVTDGPKTFEQSNTNFAAMIKGGGNGEKTISCKNTYNEGVGYGDGYVTLAVNGMEEGQKVVARFYVVLNGKTYYANYSTYTGILAEYTEVLNG